jgi:FkbM family methyltransferase
MYIPARSFLQRIGRPFVFKRYLPDSFGAYPIYVSPITGLRYWRRDLRRVDPFLCALAERYVGRGETVWDVGANIGLFSFCSAARAGAGGRVVAIEPDADMVRLLQRSIAANHLNVEVLPTAISDRVGFTRFQIASRARAANALAGFGMPDQMGGVAESRIVPTTTLDSLLGEFGRPALIKIDIEGAELLALRGATTLLREVRPIIACEVGDRTPEGGTTDAVTRLLIDAGYELLDASTDGTSFTPTKRAAWNTVAVHPKRAA